MSKMRCGKQGGGAKCFCRTCEGHRKWTREYMRKRKREDGAWYAAKLTGNKERYRTDPQFRERAKSAYRAWALANPDRVIMYRRKHHLAHLMASRLYYYLERESKGLVVKGL